MFKSLKRRDLLILGTFWITTACTVGVMLAFFMLRSSGLSQPTYQLNAGEITAHSLLPVAQEAALAWESDAQFVSASATWNHATLAELEQPVEWIYCFYSPGLQRLLFVIVTPGREVIVRPHLDKTRRELRLVNPNDWRMDSPAAITAWLNHGGGEWLQFSAERIVSAQLTQNLQTNGPMWTISGLNSETGESFVYTIEANQP